MIFSRVLQVVAVSETYPFLWLMLQCAARLCAVHPITSWQAFGHFPFRLLQTILLWTLGTSKHLFQFLLLRLVDTYVGVVTW